MEKRKVIKIGENYAVTLPRKYRRKIIPIGKSLGVTLPYFWVKNLLEKGITHLQIAVVSDEKLIIVPFEKEAKKR